VKRVSYLLIAIVPLLIAAAPSSKAQTLKDAAPFIDKANSEWAEAIVTGDADVMSAPYATDGIFIAPDGTAIHGRAAVRAMYAKRPATVKVLKATIKSDGRAAHDPDDVYEWGTARMTLKRGKAVREVSGRYLTVWRRDGKRWLISRNIAF
jgi:ketosteroid isomerase-like protein